MSKNAKNKDLDIYIFASSYVLKDVKSDKERIFTNINNIFEIFPEDDFLDLEIINPYLHKETKQVIDKILELVLSGDVPNKLSYNNKNNVLAKAVGVFIDYILNENTHEGMWDKILGEII